MTTTTTPTDIERIEAELREGPLRCGKFCHVANGPLGQAEIHGHDCCAHTAPTVASFIASRERKLRAAVVEVISRRIALECTDESCAVCHDARILLRDIESALAAREGE